MTIWYPDVSNNNWRTTAEAIAFLRQLVPEGFSAVCHKVSEGDYYRDPYWPAVADWCQRSDFLLAGYHYVSTNDPARQAALYVSAVGDPGIPCMLDFEANSGDMGNYWAVVNAFNDAGVEIALSYLPHWYWARIGRPDLSEVPGLVSSSYFGGVDYASTLYEDAGADDGPGWDGYGGAAPVCWQFTNQALIAGKTVDCNAFRGSLDDFKQLLGITPTDEKGPLMALTDEEQHELLNTVRDIQIQQRGPGLAGWAQLNGHTIVDALAEIGLHAGIPGYSPPGRKTTRKAK